MKYRASIKLEKTGQEIIVLPRSKKTGLFSSITDAVKMIERKGRAGLWGQGRVYDLDKNLVYTIAI